MKSTSFGCGYNFSPNAEAIAENYTNRVKTITFFDVSECSKILFFYWSWKYKQT